MNLQLPDLGEGIYEAELVEWLVQPGDMVKHGQTLAEVMTDKATMDLPSPFTGRIDDLSVERGEEVKVGQPILTYTAVGPGRRTGPEEAETTPEPISVADATPTPAPTATKGNGRSRTESVATLGPPTAPSVRRLARKLDIDLAKVHGSGPCGRILIDDLAQFINVARQSLQPQKQPTERHADRPALTPGTRVKLRGLRRKIAEHLVNAKHTIPHYTYVDECDVTDLVRMRDSLKDHFAKSDVKLTYLPFVVMAVVEALKQLPLVNASLDDGAGEIVLHDGYHIGVATDTPNGLLVPVVRDADKKQLLQIAREIERLTAAARSGAATRDDLRGSTFTITSIGGIGGLISTPIINHPEVGILGIGKIVKRPVFDDSGNIRPAHMLYLSFSFDHRVIDGAVAATFSNAIIAQLENPATMLVS